MSTPVTRPPLMRRRLRLPVAAVVVAGAVTAAVLVLAGGGHSPAVGGALVAPGITVSPPPGSSHASPQSQISFLGAAPAAVRDVSVVGSRSGRHAGRVASYASARGASFLPTQAFEAGERVTVSAPAARVRYSFTVAKLFPLSSSEQPKPATRATTSGAMSFVSAPSLHPARVSVLRRTAGTPAGDVFVTPLGANAAPTDGNPAPTILDGAGHLVWQGSVPAGEQAMNFGPQSYKGKPVLTWWQGRLTSLGFGEGEDVIVDSAYRIVATVHAGNGSQADLHDIELTPQGSAYVTAYRPLAADLSAYGGPKNGVIEDAVIQQVDVKSGLVMSEWSALDHISPGDSYAKPVANTPWDPFHVNSIDVQASGSLLLSMRNTWAVYEVDSRTGKVAWILGGKRSAFPLSREQRFAWQHDARDIGGGEISLFDDEAAPTAGNQSRGMVFRLDLHNHSATVVAHYTHQSPSLLSTSQGDMRLLPGGDVFVGWGAEPYYSEFSKDGRLLYDARLPGPDASYRAFTAGWSAKPAAPPAVAVGRSGAGTVVYASWNGATDVSRWEVLAGPSASALAPVASAPRTDFETATRVPTASRYYAVRAVGAGGQVLGTSRAVAR